MNPAQKITGLGDAAAIIAKPVARLIDTALGTDLENCGDCEERRQRWNEAVPFHAPDVAPRQTPATYPCMNCGRK